jgi:hypothetical protein
MMVLPWRGTDYGSRDGLGISGPFAFSDGDGIEGSFHGASLLLARKREIGTG